MRMWVQRTYKCMLRKCTLCACTTLMGIPFQQQTRADVELSMMKWIWLISRSRNSITLCTSPFSNLPVCIPFFLTPPNHPHLPWLHHYHPFSFLCSSSQLSAPAAFSSSFLFFIAHIFPPSPSGSWLKTHTQTDSGTERQPGSDLHTEL